MKKLIPYLLVIWVFTSCQDSDTVSSVTINDTYSIEVPSFLSEAKDLHEDASLQYQNTFKEFYVVVIDESKESLHTLIEDAELTGLYSKDFEGFTQINLDHFESVVTDFSQIEPIDTVINDLHARTVTVSGKVDGIDIYYAIAFIDGRDNYYQVMTWTLKTKKDDFAERMDRMINSFKEI